MCPNAHAISSSHLNLIGVADLYRSFMSGFQPSGFLGGPNSGRADKDGHLASCIMVNPCLKSETPNSGQSYGPPIRWRTENCGHPPDGPTAQRAQFRSLGYDLASGKAMDSCQSNPQIALQLSLSMSRSCCPTSSGSRSILGLLLGAGDYRKRTGRFLFQVSPSFGL